MRKRNRGNGTWPLVMACMTLCLLPLGALAADAPKTLEELWPEPGRRPP